MGTKESLYKTQLSYRNIDRRKEYDWSQARNQNLLQKKRYMVVVSSESYYDGLNFIYNVAETSNLEVIYFIDVRVDMDRKNLDEVVIVFKPVMNKNIQAKARRRTIKIKEKSCQSSSERTQ